MEPFSTATRSLYLDLLLYPPRQHQHTGMHVAAWALQKQKPNANQNSRNTTAYSKPKILNLNLLLCNPPSPTGPIAAGPAHFAANQTVFDGQTSTCTTPPRTPACATPLPLAAWGLQKQKPNNNQNWTWTWTCSRTTALNIRHRYACRPRTRTRTVGTSDRPLRPRTRTRTRSRTRTRRLGGACGTYCIIPTVRIVSVLILVIECFKQILHKTPWTLRELDGFDLDFSGISMHDMAFLRGTIWNQ